MSIWTLNERRKNRSTDSSQALRYQLEHSREHGGLEAMVIADEQGLVVAGAGEPGVVEELGAIAPLMSRAVLGMPLPPMLRGGEVAVRPIQLHGQELFVACVGGGVARDALLSNSVNGVMRILSAN